MYTMNALTRLGTNLFYRMDDFVGKKDLVLEFIACQFKGSECVKSQRRSFANLNPACFKCLVEKVSMKT